MYSEAIIARSIVAGQGGSIMTEPLYTSDEISSILKKIDVLNTLKDVDTILDRILSESRHLSNADAGSIFLVRDDCLVFSYVQNDSLFDREKGRAALYTNLTVPMSHKSIVGHAALTKEPVIINDAYHLPAGVPYRFNTSFDEKYGYRTMSIMTMPLLTIENRLVGVLELINARDKDLNVIPFKERSQLFVSLFANNAAVTIERGIMNRELILRMMSMAELRDPNETGAHVQRVAAYSAEIYQRWAENQGLDDNQEIKSTRDLIRLAAMLHDVGKVGIPDAILKKTGRLTDDEFEIIKKHTLYGARLFTSITSELDRMSLEIALNHHERWDGAGYPGCVPEVAEGSGHGVLQKKGEEIPITARVTALADVYDALCSRRVYKEAWDDERAFAIIRKNSGTQFDPEVVDAFFQITDVLSAIREKFQ
ncbi:cyclic di-GMP phosphodiesterase response regulator RpfG [bacterium BMS3Bbin14]|nr:cyclic di-GMP phosphodiesterase response regulator RpfG [bacterium BMS3Abin13]GBE53288.1 cyclic di-GMP phosphodiesterase response regulator RpfG [bacterium BMS3Bbin14]